MTYRFPSTGSASSPAEAPVAEPAEAGHIGDNSMSVFFASERESCDGTLGLRATFPGENNRREFWADAIWFTRIIAYDELMELLRRSAIQVTGSRVEGLGSPTPTPSAGATEGDRRYTLNPIPSLPENAHLVVYLIACGSVPRISINDVWHVVSPEYFPA